MKALAILVVALPVAAVLGGLLAGVVVFWGELRLEQRIRRGGG